MGRLDEEVTEDGHGEGGERGGERTDPDFAALVRQGHVLWHGRDFPFLAPGVKFRPDAFRARKFLLNSNDLNRFGGSQNRGDGLDRRPVLGHGRVAPLRTQEPRAWRINRRYDACARDARSVSSLTS